MPAASTSTPSKRSAPEVITLALVRGCADRSWSAGRSAFPSVAHPAFSDKPPHDDYHVRERHPEIDHSSFSLRTPHQLLVGVVPRIGPLDGLLAKDKFCMIRRAQISLSHSRRPNPTRRQTDGDTDARAYPPAGITRHGGDDETSVARTSGSGGTSGCPRSLGPSVPGHPSMEPGKRAGSRSGRERQGGVP